MTAYELEEDAGHRLAAIILAEALEGWALADGCYVLAVVETEYPGLGYDIKDDLYQTVTEELTDLVAYLRKTYL